MQADGCKDLVKDKDDESFLYAFDYFFHSDCDEITDVVHEKVARYAHDCSRFLRTKANCINSLTSKHPKRNVFLTEISWQFIESLGEEISKEVFHLNLLLEQPIIQNLFAAYDQVIKYINNSEFSLASHSQPDCSCYLSGSRLVKIVVSAGEELGIRLDVDGATGLAYVGELSESGAAHKSGCIQQGDYILEIDGEKTRFKSGDNLKALLSVEHKKNRRPNRDNNNNKNNDYNKDGDRVGNASNVGGDDENEEDEDCRVCFSLLVESYPNQKQHFPYFIRARKNFSVNSVSNEWNVADNDNMILNVNKSDIFEVLGRVDERWLKARFVGNGTLFPTINGQETEPLVGLIPQRIDREEAAGGTSSRSSSSLSLHSDETAPQDADNASCTSSDKAAAASYERLVLSEPPGPHVARCLLLVGPSNVGRNELKRALLNAFPETYANVVPHTTRPPRRHEIDGVHYNFVDLLSMEQLIRDGECVEHGEYNENLYGTTYASILRLMECGRTPIINVNPRTIHKLRNAIFKPLIIFVKPPDILTLKQTRSQPITAGGLTLSAHFSDLDFKEMIAAAGNIQRTYGEFFDATLVNSVFCDAFDELCRLIDAYKTQHQFIPRKWIDWI